MSHLRSPRAIIGALLALLLGAFTVLASPAPAANAADEGYRYWGVWQLEKAAWKFATEGPGTLKVKQGDVIGFRYAAQSMNDSRPPRDTTITFEKVCGTQKVDQGKVAVAIVIDHGRAADSESGSDRIPTPRAQCAVVDADTPVARALGSVADVRNDAKGAICGIDSYPVSGCMDAVAKLSDAAKAKDDTLTIAIAEPGAVVVTNNPTDVQQDAAANPAGTASPAQGSSSGPGNGLLLGVGAIAVLALAGLAFWFLRRNRDNATSSRVVGGSRETAGATRSETTVEGDKTEGGDGDFPTRRSRRH